MQERPNQKIFSSSMVKLLKQSDRFAEWERRIYRPISLQVAPTDKCNLKCSFCSVKNRAGDELDYDVLITTIGKLIEYGIKTIEFTGGGDPTLYPYINEVVEYCYKKKLGIGLITNGVALVGKIPQRTLDMFDWVRISLNSLDYVNDIEIPVFRKIDKNTTLGFSYVINENSVDMVFDKIKGKLDKYGAEYLRVVPNCLSIDTMESSKKILENSTLLNHPKVFWQEKDYEVSCECYVGYIKPFLNSDGYFYQCSANPLIDRKFHSKFRMGSIGEIDKIWTAPYKVFNTSLCQKGKCFFKEQNDLLNSFAQHPKHRDFI